MPLFHLLSAPIFALTGNDVRVLFVARIAMLPLFFLSLLLVHTISSRLWGERTAWWAVSLLAAFPPYFLGTLEYRADDLWVVLWLLAIAVFVGDRPIVWKGLIGGVVIGLSFAVSLKTTLFVISIAAANVLAFALTRRRSGIRTYRTFIQFTVAAFLPMILIPCAIYSGFALAGAAGSFRYGVFEHNIFPFEHAWRVVLFIPLYFTARPIALRMARSEGDTPIVRRRLFVFLCFAGYVTALLAFWPMLSFESYLPFYPLGILLLTPLLLEWTDRREWLEWSRMPSFAIPAFAVALGVVTTVAVAKPWSNDAKKEIELISEVLAITNDDEPVMGEHRHARGRVGLAAESIEAIRSFQLPSLGNLPRRRFPFAAPATGEAVCHRHSSSRPLCRRRGRPGARCLDRRQAFVPDHGPEAGPPSVADGDGCFDRIAGLGKGVEAA